MNGLAKRLKTQAIRTREIRERERLLAELKKMQRANSTWFPRETRRHND